MLSTLFTRAVRAVASSALVLAIGGFALADRAAAQSGAVAGTIIDAVNAQPLSNAQVTLPGTQPLQGTLTLADGRYRFANLSPGEYQVRVALIGYNSATQTVTVVANQVATVDFTLDVSAVQLDELVVQAITGQDTRRRELGTNIGTLQVTDIPEAGLRTFTDVMQGRVTGVAVRQINGTPGTGPKIRIRGANSVSLSNEPLIFIDGVQVRSGTTNPSGADPDDGSQFYGTGGQDGSRLSDLNPNDIENIQVIKGPAASALYGSAAANGVILINTKRGSTGGGSDWNLYGELSESEDRHTYPTNVASFDNPSGGPVFNPDGTPTGNGTFCTTFQAADGTCNLDTTLRINMMEDPRTSPFSKGDAWRAGLNVAGGGDAVTFYASGDINQETGVVAFTWVDKVNFRLNLNAQAEQSFNLSFNAGYTRDKIQLPHNDNSIFSYILNPITGAPEFFPDGDLGPTNNVNFGFAFDLDDLSNLTARNDVDRFTGGINANWALNDWFSLNGNAGLDLSESNNFQSLQPNLLPIAASFAAGFRDSQRRRDILYTFNFSGAFSFDLGQTWTSRTTTGGSYQEQSVNWTQCSGSGIVVNTTSCRATSNLFAVDEHFSQTNTVGLFVQQEFSWRNTVFLSGAFRADDSSATGGDIGWETYPAASASWVLSQEDFFNVDWISELRLRGAFGTSGLRPQFRNALTLFASVPVQVQGSNQSGVTITSNGNEELLPERTTEWEAGFDAGFLNNRIGVEFAYFNKSSKDALVARPVAPSLGINGPTTAPGTVFDNIGKITNTGTETQLRIAAVDTRNVQWGMTFQYTTVNNNIAELGLEDDITFNSVQRHRDGFPAGSYFQFPIQFEDTDGNGLLSPSEIQTVCADGQDPNNLPDGAICEAFIDESLPTYYGSFTTNIYLFNWIRVETFFEGQGGHSTLNDSRRFRCSFGLATQYGCTGFSDPNAPLDLQAASYAGRFAPPNSQVGTSRADWIEPADFLKWRELSFTFDMPPSLRKNRLLSGISVTFAGRNLQMWTRDGFRGVDPENNSTGSSTNFSSDEFFTQPPLRYLTARLNIRL